MKAEVFQAIGIALALGAMLQGALKARGVRPAWAALLSLVAGMALASVPVFWGLALWQWVLSFVDHISATAIVLLSAHLLGRAGLLRQDNTCWRAAMGFVLCYGLLLYASGLGFAGFGIYESGYDAGWVFWAAVIGAAMAGFLGRMLLWACLATAILAHVAGIFPSGNINDALMDAGLFLAIACILIARLVKGLLKQRPL